MLETVITTSDFMVKKKKKTLKGCTIFNLSEAGSSFLRGGAGDVAIPKTKI